MAGSESGAALCWILGAVIASFGAFTFADLALLESGQCAPYRILRRAYGPGVGFIGAFGSITGTHVTAIAILAILCVRHLNIALGMAKSAAAAEAWQASCLVVILSTLHLLGVRFAAGTQRLTVAIRILVILALFGIALSGAQVSRTADASAAPIRFVSTWSGLGGALFAFMGWHHALFLSGETTTTNNALRRGILVGFAIVAALYGMANWSYFSILGFSGVVHSGAVGSDAAAKSRLGDTVVAAAIAVSALGSLNTLVLSGPRMAFALAKDKLVFSIFGKLYAGVPAPAIALQTSISLFLILAFGAPGLNSLVNVIVLMEWGILGLVGFAAIALKRQLSGGAQRASAPIPRLFILGAVFGVSSVFSRPDQRVAGMAGILWLAAGGLVYLLMTRLQQVGVRRPLEDPPPN
jgi:APA family basic amino acid/polyamine antiporter